MRELRIVAPLHALTGYAKSARALLASALAAGFTVEAIELEVLKVRSGRQDGTVVETSVPRHAGKPLPEVQRVELETALTTRVRAEAPTFIMAPAPELALWETFCRGPRIGLTMIEADTLSPFWARAARNVDALATVSNWCLETLRTAAPDIPGYVLPVCVDERLWQPVGSVMEIPGRPAFLFFAVFSTQERKHWRQLLQAFAEEFRGEDAGLLIKPSHHFACVQEMADWCADMGVWVQIVTAEWTDAQMAAAYRAGDCYVLPSSEGFGNPNVEAMLCGRPAIALDAGGTADVVDSETGYPVPAVWESCQGLFPQFFRSRYRWPACEVGELRRVMRCAYADLQQGETAAKRGEAVREAALGRWRRQAVGERLAVIYDAVVARWEKDGQIAKSPATNLPTPGAQGQEERAVSSSPRVARGMTALVTTHDHLDRTRRCVTALRAATPGAHIVLADDASSDLTREWAASEAIAFLACDTRNLSRNRNLALERLRRERPEDTVVFFDNDVEVGEGWWEGLADILERFPKIGLLAPRKVTPEGDTQNVGCRMHYNGMTEPLLLRRELVWPDYVETACLAARPEVWRALDFDETFPFWYEDCDYTFAARQAGWEVAATANVTVIHHAHTTSRARIAEFEQSRHRFLRKWKEHL